MEIDFSKYEEFVRFDNFDMGGPHTEVCIYCGVLADGYLYKDGVLEVDWPIICLNCTPPHLLLKAALEDL